MKCNSCGFENDEGVTYCHQCGVNLKGSDFDNFKRNVDVLNKDFKVEKKRQPYPAPPEDSIKAKLMYKRDPYSGKLRIAKTKCATIVVFTAFFLFSFGISLFSGNVIASLFVALAFGLVFALPVFVVGYLIGKVIDMLTH